MQFLVMARDAADATERRSALREAHLALANELVKSNSLLYGVALLGEDGKPTGSVEVVESESRARLDEWLGREPFVVGKVWEQVDVFPCRVGPMFQQAR